MTKNEKQKRKKVKFYKKEKSFIDFFDKRFGFFDLFIYKTAKALLEFQYRFYHFFIGVINMLQKKMPLAKLRRRRIQMRVTQKTMARRLQVTPQFYSEIERGLNVLSYQNALIIAEFLDTTTDDLFKEAFDHLYEEEQQRQWDKEHPRW